MKNKLKISLALLTACALLFAAALPIAPSIKALSAEALLYIEDMRTAPEGYNENDYCKLAAFLEQTDYDGIKNGEKLSSTYDPNDPETWGTYWAVDDYGYTVEFPRFVWQNVQGELRLARILLNDCYVSGSLDLSDCTALEWFHCIGNGFTTLNVSGCTALVDFECAFSGMSELDVSGCTALEYLNCSGAYLEALDISDCTALRLLDCSANRLTELDVSSNPSIGTLRCQYNYIGELDFSNNPYLPIDGVFASGCGAVGYQFDPSWEVNTVYASPLYGAEFEGWYNNSEFIGMGVEFEQFMGSCWYYECAEAEGTTVFVAHFVGGTEPQPALPGDADGNGTVNIADGITALRFTLGLVEESSIALENADINGDGSVSVADAILILRIALGL